MCAGVGWGGAVILTQLFGSYWIGIFLHNTEFKSACLSPPTFFSYPPLSSSLLSSPLLSSPHALLSCPVLSSHPCHQTRPTPPHLTSAMAENILAAACESESRNAAKRMRLDIYQTNVSVCICVCSVCVCQCISVSVFLLGYVSHCVCQCVCVYKDSLFGQARAGLE